jgi:hypothetical protein
MGIIANTAKNIALTIGLLAGKPGLEGKAVEEKRYPAFEQGYRMRPPGAVCDPTKYGGNPTQAPPDPRILYAALGMVGVAVLAHTLRKNHEQYIKNSEPARSWDFFDKESPVVDYEIEREERDF